MGEKIRIVIPVAPTGQMRARAVNRGRFAGVYKAKEQKGRENKLLHYLMQSAPPEPMLGPIEIMMKALMPRPKSHYGTGSKASILKESAPFWHTSRPDLDNIEKMILDCMNKVYFVDDSQVCMVKKIKHYVNVGAPRWEIEVSQLEDSL